jgi:parvulin-like peptidyl-prolyl isomerase
MSAITRLAFLTLLPATLSLAADKTLVEGIVVRVNDHIMTTADIRQRIAEREGEAGQAMPADQIPLLIQEAADELCILERASELKLEVTPEEIDSTMKQLREQNNAKDDATFDAVLRNMGMTLEQLRNRMRDTMLINRLLSREVGSLPVTEAELRRRYERDKEKYRLPERVHLYHVVFPLGKEPGDEERKRVVAKRLVTAARAGEDFKTLVDREVAAGLGSGGDLGEVAVPDLRPEVKEAVATLKIGEISDPFKSSAGLHVVRLLEQIAPGFKPFESLSEELRQQELAERYKGHLANVVAELKTRYVVETHPEIFSRRK